MKTHCAAVGWFWLSMAVSGHALSQTPQPRLFPESRFIGEGTGSPAARVSYQPNSGTYQISGGGANIWDRADAFRYVYRKMDGDFIVYARARFTRPGGDPRRKLGWMIRHSLDTAGMQVSVAAHGDGLTALQFRKTPGGLTEEIRSAVTHADVLELERKRDTFIMRVAVYGQPFVSQRLVLPGMDSAVYVGMFVCAHDSAALETAHFDNVRLTVPYSGAAGQEPPMRLGSRLEILDVASGDRRVVLQMPHSIQAPNWTRDGQSLVFNDAGGTLYRFKPGGGPPRPIFTGKVNHNNNDHVLSFDGRMIGLSSHVQTLGGSVIYTVPLEGGQPRQITPRGPSYLHGWSPDGKYLVFCGQRQGEFDVYRIPSTGGEEQRLTSTPGLDDGPEYSPDGRFIYFNSVRSGSMQIWRMKPDGSDPEQLTNDSFYNWFPHVSPDGKHIVFLSFLPEETAADRHPPYKHVMVRIMDASGGEPSVLAYLYGGQGSMNTPCWSPDSRKIAFVSNTGPYP